jgi:ATP-dependent Clp protease adaptor protein ClpS
MSGVTAMGNQMLGIEQVVEVLAQKVDPTLKKPRMYRVFLQNDDYTPMDFVVLVLQQFFYKTKEDAINIMLQVHNTGKGICGTYTHDVAETKVSQVSQFSEQHEYPLLCGLEAV